MSKIDLTDLLCDIRILGKKLTTIYRKEELEYIQSQIIKIRNSVEDKSSQLAEKTVS